jgi:hypothetical protein
MDLGKLEEEPMAAEKQESGPPTNDQAKKAEQ